MILLATMAAVKDWADLLHAVAWPIVALVALYLFRKSIDHSVRDVLRRIPWERTTSVRARGLGEVQLTKKIEQKIVETVRIPPQFEPPKEAEKDT
jgi:hypothetical protein